jgi:methionyl-tRNA formyltransferase
MKILIIGRTEILYNTILELSKKHSITGIITSHSVNESKVTEKDFEALSIKFNCPFINIKRITEDTNEFIKNLKADVGISINWVSVISKETINLLPYGVLNAHFADLPRFRGNAVVNWAIIKGEKTIPLTIHKMEHGKLDSGDILVQKFLTIKDDTTIKDIYEKAEKYVPILFSEALEIINKKEQNLISQKKRNHEAFRCYPRVPEDSRINWNDSAKKIDRLIRATTNPFSGAYTYFKDTNGKIKKVYIWKSRVVKNKTKDLGIPGHIIMNDKESGESWIYTGKGILGINEITFVDGEIIQPGIYFKSIRLKFEFDIETELINLQNEIKEITNLIAKQI